MVEILRYMFTHMNTDVGNLFGAVAFDFLNMGLWLGITFGAILLLRPVTNRILRPRQRVSLWFLGWFSGFIMYSRAFYWNIKVLPVSFYSLMVPRVSKSARGVPYFLPDVNGVGGGEHTIMLPGGVEIPVTISDGMITMAGVAFLGILIGYMVWETWRSKKLFAGMKQHSRLTPEQMKEYGIDRTDVAVYRCTGLVSSYVRAAVGKEERKRGERFVICLQDELSEDQLQLVLLHEMAHIELHHPWWKGTCSAILILYWWNPILWLAYRLTCRDMELDCDEKVLETLEKGRHRDYALTLVELATEKHMDQGFTCFGECDASLRVRRVAAWKPAGQFRQLVSLSLMVLLALFFYCGSWGVQPGEVMWTKEGWSWEEVSIDNSEYIMNLTWPSYITGIHLQNDLKQWLGVTEIQLHNVWCQYQRDMSHPYFWVELEDGTWYYCQAEYVDCDYDLTNVVYYQTGPDHSGHEWHCAFLYEEETA